MMKKILNFMFPSFCWHCQMLLEESNLICKGCSSHFELIDPMTRCPHCFSENSQRSACFSCVKKKWWGIKLASACDLAEGVLSLTRCVKDGKNPFLAKTISALMAMQFYRLMWPEIDFLIPIPKRLWIKSGNHAKLIAQALGHIIKIPTISALGCISGEWSHKSGLNLEKKRFYLKRKYYLEGKTILLIDDIIYTGNTFHCAARVLKEAGAAHVYALSFARSMR